MRVALVTAPANEAEELARRIIEDSLAACVNLLPGIKSIYRWEGRICTDDEVLLVIKLAERQVPKLIDRIREWHSYDCPECVVLPVETGNPAYIDWVRDPDTRS